MYAMDDMAVPANQVSPISVHGCDAISATASRGTLVVGS
jgi:hypothetical protein